MDHFRILGVRSIVWKIEPRSVSVCAAVDWSGKKTHILARYYFPPCSSFSLSLRKCAKQTEQSYLHWSSIQGLGEKLLTVKRVSTMILAFMFLCSLLASSTMITCCMILPIATSQKWDSIFQFPISNFDQLEF